MVAEREVLEDVGAGKGHLSTVQLIHEEKYGGLVILKVPGHDISKNILLISEERFQALHNTEVNMYTILGNHSEKGIRHPKVFYLESMDIHSKPVRAGCIIMEYIAGITHLTVTDNLRPDELVEPVKNLARLHALGAELTEQEKKMIPGDFLREWFKELFTEKNTNMFMKHWEGGSLMDGLMTTPESKRAIPILHEIMKPEVFSKLNDDCHIHGIQQVLCHGDSSSANLLFEKLPNGSWVFKSICDFQGSNWGNAAQDLTRLFVTSMSGKDRREKGEYLMREYYDELVRATEGNAPFTWEQLTRGYKRFLPHHAAIVCVTTPGSFLRALTGMSEGVEKQKFEERMVEKYVALMEDLSSAWKEEWSV